MPQAEMALKRIGKKFKELPNNSNLLLHGTIHSTLPSQEQEADIL